MKKCLLIFAILVLIVGGYFVTTTQAKTKYILEKDVFKTMVSWKNALGVQCSYCHVSPNSKTLQDLKEGENINAKEVEALANQKAALAMQAIISHLNEKGGNYTCGSCHKGSVKVD